MGMGRRKCWPVFMGGHFHSELSGKGTPRGDGARTYWRQDSRADRSSSTWADSSEKINKLSWESAKMVSGVRPAEQGDNRRENSREGQAAEPVGCYRRTTHRWGRLHARVSGAVVSCVYHTSTKHSCCSKTLSGTVHMAAFDLKTVAFPARFAVSLGVRN